VTAGPNRNIADAVPVRVHQRIKHRASCFPGGNDVQRAVRKRMTRDSGAQQMAGLARTDTRTDDGSGIATKTEVKW
jgi:hypothetical protein